MGDWRCIEVRYSGSTYVMTDVYRPLIGDPEWWKTLVATDHLVVEEYTGPVVDMSYNQYLIWVHWELVDA